MTKIKKSHDDKHSMQGYKVEGHESEHYGECFWRPASYAQGKSGGYWERRMKGPEKCKRENHPWPNDDGTLGPIAFTGDDSTEASW